MQNQPWNNWSQSPTGSPIPQDPKNMKSLLSGWVTQTAVIKQVTEDEFTEIYNYWTVSGPNPRRVKASILIEGTTTTNHNGLVSDHRIFYDEFFQNSDIRLPQ